jgi:hypothetical protein
MLAELRMKLSALGGSTGSSVGSALSQPLMSGAGSALSQSLTGLNHLLSVYGTTSLQAAPCCEGKDTASQAGSRLCLLTSDNPAGAVAAGHHGGNINESHRTTGYSASQSARPISVKSLYNDDDLLDDRDDSGHPDDVLMAFTQAAILSSGR